MDIEMQQSLSTSSNSHPQTGALRTIRWSIFWVSLPFGVLEFVLPIYGKAVGADAVQIGLFFTVFFVMLVLLRPLVGIGLDRYGRRPFFLAGLVGYALTMCAFALSNGVAGVLIARILQGTASALMWLAAQAITADTAGANDRGRSFGSVGQSSSQGAILGTFIGFSVLIPMGMMVGWKPLFMVYAIAGLLAAGMAWRSLKETNPASQSSQLPSVSRSIVWSRPWILLLLVTLVTASAWTMLSPILIIYLQEKLGAETTELAYAYLPSALVWSFLPSYLGRLADRFGRKPLMILGLVSAAVTSFLIPSLTTLLSLAALWAVQAVCYAAGDPAEQALVADLTDGDQRGRAYGLYAAAGSLGGAIGPLVGGWLYQSVSPQAPFIANGVILAACGVILAIWLRVPDKNGEKVLC